jgi:hypothetical protein
MIPYLKGEPERWRWVRSIFRDIHFWVPMAALLAGALILYFVQ